MDQSKPNLVQSDYRTSLWTFSVLGSFIIAGRFILNRPGSFGTLAETLLIVFCAVTGMFFLRNILLTFFSDRASSIVLVLVVAGTNLFSLITYQHDRLHPFLF